jgi:hypothetical protein
VTWDLEEPDPDWLVSVLGSDEAATVDYAEEHHRDGPMMQRTGTVAAIREVHYRLAPPDPQGAPNVLYPVTGSVRFRAVSKAERWPKELAGLEFGGFLVNLRISAT